MSPPLTKLLHLSTPVCGCFLLSLVSGYPVGAATVRARYDSGHISKAEAERSLAFCNNCGPAFLLGALAAALQSMETALLLWGSHVVSALLTALLFRMKGSGQKAPEQESPQSFSAALTGSAREAAAAMARIGSLVVLFQVFLVLPRKAGLFALTEGTLWQGLLTGLLELTGGVAALAGYRGAAAAAITALITGWGGLCVHLQTVGVLEGSGLSLRYYFAGKAVQSLLSGAVAWAAAAWLLPGASEAMTVVSPNVTLHMNFENMLLFAAPWLALLALTAFLCRRRQGDDYSL